MPLANPIEDQHVKMIDAIADRLKKTLPAPAHHLKIIVTIPAKNEENDIENILMSLLRQKVTSQLNPKTIEVLVLCHNCTDQTFLKCKDFFKSNTAIQGHVLELNSETANTIGAARRILMNIAAHRLSVDYGFIVCTDADTVADEKWFHYLNTYLQSKYAMICGLIDVDPKNLSLQAATFLKAKDEYLLLKSKLEAKLLPNVHDPWPRHNYNWGPNIAIKKKVYEAIGGIKPLHFLEDVDMYNRVMSAGFLVRHCRKVKVTTSTRINPRCNEGFGAELKDWTEIEGVKYLVEGYEKLVLRFDIYKRIKKQYSFPTEANADKIKKLAYISDEELSQLIMNSSCPEAAKIKMEIFLSHNEKWNQDHQNTEVFEACAQIRSFFKLSQTASLLHP